MSSHSVKGIWMSSQKHVKLIYLLNESVGEEVLVCVRVCACGIDTFHTERRKWGHYVRVVCSIPPFLSRKMEAISKERNKKEVDKTRQRERRRRNKEEEKEQQEEGGGGGGKRN